MRYPIIDGFRGFFLIFMMVVHSNIALDAILGKLNHHYLGWVEDAQGFVFISGLVVGLVYTGRFLKGGRTALFRTVADRIRTIYQHQVFLILVFLSLGTAMASMGAQPDVLKPYVDEPVAFTLASLVLVTGSNHMGILPMYIFFLAATPFLILTLHRGLIFFVIALSTGLWLFAQMGVPDYLVHQAERMSLSAGHPINLGIFFNVFGWQALFVAGLIFGYLTATKKLSLDVLHAPTTRSVFLLTLAMLVLLALFDRIVFWKLLGMEFTQKVLAATDRGNLSVIYLISFAVASFAVVWLIQVGDHDRSRVVRLMARCTTAVFSWAPLVFLGRHSLHAFTAHLLCVYAIDIWFVDGPPSPVVGNLIILASPLPLFLVAWVNEHHLRWSRSLSKLKSART